MKKLLAAVTLSIAIPSIALAQAAPAPPPKEDCCEKMKAEGHKCCCGDMDKKDHAEHDKKSADHGATHDKHKN